MMEGHLLVLMDEGRSLGTYLQQRKDIGVRGGFCLLWRDIYFYHAVSSSGGLLLSIYRFLFGIQSVLTCYDEYIGMGVCSLVSGLIVGMRLILGGMNGNMV